MQQGYRVTCPRCGGSGRLAQHSAVLGGVCFACKGSGFRVQKSRPAAPAVRFAVSACSLRTGERVSPVFWLLAKSERQALTKARAQIAKGNGYDPATVSVSMNP
jgi:hypothetical protein